MKFDKYDFLLELMNFPHPGFSMSVLEEDKNFREVFILMKDIGLVSGKKKYDLIIWNNDINTTDEVVKALQVICNVEKSESTNKMMEAHINGKSVILQGPLRRLFPMIKRLKLEGITATMELIS